MDALSDILNSIRLKGCVYFRNDFCSPWGMEMDSGRFALFHLVVRGQCWLKRAGDDAPRVLNSGDIVVFPHGDGHWLADDPSHARVPGHCVLEAHARHQPMFDHGRLATTLPCGHVEFDRGMRHPFLDALPRIIHLPGLDRHHLGWLEVVSNVLIEEARSSNPGAQIVVNRLSEGLFVQILRAYIADGGDARGFLAALADRRVSRALDLIHARPHSNLTLDELAASASMSRSLFATRFKDLVGLTPMDYLATWRMNKARELLTESSAPLAQIAERVGYASETAFHRAFKKIFQITPGAMRRGQAA